MRGVENGYDWIELIECRVGVVVHQELKRAGDDVGKSTSSNHGVNVANS